MIEEVERILKLPVAEAENARCPDAESFGLSCLNPSRADKSFTLREKQIDAVWTYLTMGGAITPLSVGLGKTVVAILCSVLAIRSRGHKRVVILLPPTTFSQFVDRQLPEERERLDLQGVSFHPVRGTAAQRMDVCKRVGSGVWIYSYSSLSGQKGYEEMMEIGATAYIMDEAHNVARTKTTRTKRLHTVWTEVANQPDKTEPGAPPKMLEVVVLSGTLTKKSPKDYAHLANAALGIKSPVPIRESVVEALASIVDATPRTDAQAPNIPVVDKKAIGDLIRWSIDNGHDPSLPDKIEGESEDEYKRRCRTGATFEEQVRSALQHRIRTAPGVIASSASGVDSSLIIRWQEPSKDNASEYETTGAGGFNKMIELMQRVVINQETPNGDPIEYGMHGFKWLWELSNGFYNALAWPTVDEWIRSYKTTWHRDITEEEAQVMLERGRHHLEEQRAYYKALRDFLDRGHYPGVDTPLLVASEIKRQADGHPPKCVLPRTLVELYNQQRASGPHTFPDIPQRLGYPVRVCDYKIRAAVDWAETLHGEKEGGLIWYHHPEVGLWAHELLAEAGVPHTWARAGDNEAPFQDGIVLASYSHGTGKNLQHQHNNLLLELRREASVLEQTIGRTHRSGQKADEVSVDVFVSNLFDRAMFCGAINDAAYIASTFGQLQRLCYATYDPVVPPVDPRLMHRLGIIKELPDRLPNGQPWEQITPASLKQLATWVRPVAFGTPVSR